MGVSASGRGLPEARPARLDQSGSHWPWAQPLLALRCGRELVGTQAWLPRTSSASLPMSPCWLQESHGQMATFKGGRSLCDGVASASRSTRQRSPWVWSPSAGIPGAGWHPPASCPLHPRSCHHSEETFAPTRSLPFGSAICTERGLWAAGSALGLWGRCPHQPSWPCGAAGQVSLPWSGFCGGAPSPRLPRAVCKCSVPLRSPVLGVVKAGSAQAPQHNHFLASVPMMTNWIKN